MSQVKNLSLKIEQEIQKRTLTQNDLKVQNQQLSTLKTSEKQLKQEINHLLDIKRSLEKQIMELRKYGIPQCTTPCSISPQLAKTLRFGIILSVCVFQRASGFRWTDEGASGSAGGGTVFLSKTLASYKHINTTKSKS